MTDRTLGIIKAIKQSGLRWDRAVSRHMSWETGTPEENYSETDLNQILKAAFLDFLSTCDDPAMEVGNLLDMMESSGTHSMGYHLANMLGIAQVCRLEGDEKTYVNGFRDWED